MAIILSGIRVGIEESEQAAIDKARRLARTVSPQVYTADIAKISLDARKKDQIKLVYSVRLTLEGDEQAAADKLITRLGANAVRVVHTEPLHIEQGGIPLEAPIAVVGFGPAGMFAALTLAEQGYPVVVLERGADMDRRVGAVEAFWQGGAFSPQTNVQFGEGGAGTFSDGKLTTRISDSRCEHILQKLVEFGAPQEILVRAKPHIGTDRLRGVVKGLRERVLALGGQILFDTAVEELLLQNGRVTALRTNRGELAAGGVVLAIGHSARDTFSMLYRSGIAMEAKPFSVGARIEHLQSEIDRGLYGRLAGHPRLPQGEYQLSHRDGERGVYTFCMCPGGMVVPSSSEEDSVVTNGMSEFARNGRNANAALVVSVSPQDFGTAPLDGVRFQQELEKKAFLLGGKSYRAPAQDVRSFLAGKPGLRLSRVEPTYPIGITESNFNELYPDFVSDMMRTGLRRFERKLPGYAAADAILTGPETRTSSPVRILRGENCESVSCRGLYPCGEGAGYAGGIMSAAVDGIRVAQEIMKKYKP